MDKDTRAGWARFVPAGGWLLAALVSMLLSWQAVTLVRGQVTDQPAPLVSITAQDDDGTTVTEPTVATSDDDGTTATSMDDASSTSLAASPTTTVGDDDATSTTAGSPTTTIDDDDDDATSTTVTTHGSTSTTATTHGSTSTTVGPGPADQTASYDLEGGTVTIRHGNGQVELVSAVPKSGYAAKVKYAGPAKVQVEFENGSHESKFKAFYDLSGKLVIDIDEKDE